MRFLPVAALTAVALTATWSCREERHSYVPNATDGEHTPTMATADVETFISDSGYTRYHISTPLWLMFEDAAEPFWRFPDGLELEQYDLELKPESTVVCDSAVYFSRKRLWRLDGNVVMVNTAGDSFLTQQLFWDQTARKINSDSFIHIVRTDRIIEGYGFESDQSMNAYEVMQPTAILPVNRNPGEARDSVPDSTAATADSMPARTRRAAPPRRPKPKPVIAAPPPDEASPFKKMEINN